MMQPRPDTRQKALEVNLDAAKYGALAEIGAGQEVARWFFRAGRAASTVAKTISAYDMAVSDALYGRSDHYVSRKRLESMLAHEFDLLVQHLGERRGDSSTFFVFADTVATRSPYRDPASGQMITAETLPVAPQIRHLHAYLLENGCIESIHGYNANYLHISPQDVLDKIQSGDAAWESMVPAAAVKRSSRSSYLAGDRL